MEIDSVIEILLKNRGLKTQKAVEEFFHPTRPEELKSPFDSKPAIRLIKSHIKKGHKTAIYGDYDVDGLCSTAILWETLYKNYKNVFPHIPHRESEGYGLSIKGIDHCLQEGAKLIITVDNGIVAHEQVAYCRKKKCDIIIIDHHEASDQRLKANCILHSTSSCAAGLVWLFCRDYLKTEHRTPNTEHLSLVSIATICDIVPLLGANRSFAKYGLEELNRTTRPGLLALFEEAQLPSPRLGEGMGVRYLITPYHVGFIIGPRLNAAGRLEHAIDSLRLLCTKDPIRARELAASLGQTNRARQDATLTAVTHALSTVTESNLIVAADKSYHQGIIGLVAAKLVEKYYRPALAISVGERESKGSARSIPGFHITEYLRSRSHLLVDVGGHAMAAGFTVSNENLPKLLKELIQTKIDPKILVKKQRIDAEIPLTTIDQKLVARLKAFEPFGLGNPTPVFSSLKVEISDIRRLGKDNKHLKFKAGGLDAIWFNAPYNLEPSTYNLTYQIEENAWNGQTKLQLLIKDVRPSS